MIKGEVNYLALTPIGVFLLDGDGNVIDKNLFPKEPAKVAEGLSLIESGVLTPEVRELCKKAAIGVKKLVVEVEALAKAISSELKLNVSVETSPPQVKALRAKVADYALKLGFPSKMELNAFYHAVSLELAKRKLKEAVEKRDLLVAQAVTAIDDVDKTINLLVSRLREWYGVHFPELNDLLEDHEGFSRFVGEVGWRGAVSKENLLKLGLPKDKVSKVIEAAKGTIGAELGEEDLKPIKETSSVIQHLYAVRRLLEDYVDRAMDDVAPNVKRLIGPTIGARLIALAGGLEKLAKMPASTIQLLGAEKALFRFLRTGAKPPKHGVIFQCPEIHRAPRWQRGKIARALAGKLSIAARVDYFSGEYVGDELRRDLDVRIEEIKRTYAKPPVKKRSKRLKKGR
ncbi:MAG: hypothetical protein QXK12_01550 [Candidatus Nezhaarchaeales archaeon]